MEPEGSLPRSQELSTCTYREPEQQAKETWRLHKSNNLYKKTFMPTGMTEELQNDSSPEWTDDKRGRAAKRFIS
jgi:hypothetical protein